MMAKVYAMTVDVPEFDEQAAYDPDRPISSLIRTQLLHLTAAENLALPPKFRTGININTLHTEHQASEYIQRVTTLLHTHGKAEARKAAAGHNRKPAKKVARKRRKVGARTRPPRPAARKRTSRN
jgi:hypothetical protein